MAVTRGLRLCFAGAAGMLLLVGCVRSPADTASTDPPKGASSSPTTDGSGEPSGNETYGTPGTEDPNATEKPRPPNTEGPPVIDITGPDPGPEQWNLDHEWNDDCVDVRRLDPFDEDTRIVDIEVKPAPAFTRHESICDGNEGPSCEDFVFPAGDGRERCEVGVFWDHTTATEEDYTAGYQEGWITFVWKATCHTKNGPYCGQLDETPPEGGTIVTYRNLIRLRGALPDSRPETPSPTPTATESASPTPTSNETPSPTPTADPDR